MSSPAALHAAGFRVSHEDSLHPPTYSACMQCRQIQTHVFSEAWSPSSNERCSSEQSAKTTARHFLDCTFVMRLVGNEKLILSDHDPSFFRQRKAQATAQHHWPFLSKSAMKRSRALIPYASAVKTYLKTHPELHVLYDDALSVHSGLLAAEIVLPMTRTLDGFGYIHVDRQSAAQMQPTPAQ